MPSLLHPWPKVINWPLLPFFLNTNTWYYINKTGYTTSKCISNHNPQTQKWINQQTLKESPLTILFGIPRAFDNVSQQIDGPFRRGKKECCTNSAAKLRLPSVQQHYPRKWWVSQHGALCSRTQRQTQMLVACHWTIGLLALWWQQQHWRNTEDRLTVCVSGVAHRSVSDRIWIGMQESDGCNYHWEACWVQTLLSKVKTWLQQRA